MPSEPLIVHAEGFLAHLTRQNASEHTVRNYRSDLKQLCEYFAGTGVSVEALDGPQEFLAGWRNTFQERRDLVVRGLNANTGLDCLTPEGAFYTFPNLTGHLGRPIRGRTATASAELYEILLDEAKVAIVPGEAFAAPGYARLSFALGDDDLGEGCRRIADLFTEAP